MIRWQRDVSAGIIYAPGAEDLQAVRFEKQRCF